MYSDDEMKNILELKEQILREIEGYEIKLEYRKRHLELLDSLLRTSSFTKASAITPSGNDAASSESRADSKADEMEKRRDPDSDVETSSTSADTVAYDAPRSDADSGQDANTLIRRDKTGDAIASIDATPDQISITLNDSIHIRPDAPPFQGFFLDQIIGDMRRRDDLQCREGELDSQNAISYEVRQNGPFLHQIIIYNYRDKERLSKIKSSIGWTLSRMVPQ